jgi:hypothetical protein
MPGDRRKDTSMALTEIRTVRSRAESAHEKINSGDGKIEARWEQPRFDEDGNYVHPGSVAFRDEDADEISELLADFIAKTARFANKARKPGVVSKLRGN